MEIIPKPSSISRRVTHIDQGLSLADQMKLAGRPADVTLYFDIVTTVGILCDRYLPYQRSVRNMMEAKSTVIEEVKRMYNCLERYEDDWPLKVMITQHRQLRRAGSRGGLVRPLHEIRSIKQQIHGRRGHTESRVRRPTKASTSVTPASHTNHKKASTRSAQKENIPAPKSRSNTMETFSEDTANTGEAVLQFLRSLAQNLSFLLPVFVRYGVTDRDSLRSICCLQNWRAWIYTWVKDGQLTELQFTMITEGLEVMT